MKYLQPMYWLCGRQPVSTRFPAGFHRNVESNGLAIILRERGQEVRRLSCGGLTSGPGALWRGSGILLRGGLRGRSHPGLPSCGLHRPRWLLTDCRQSCLPVIILAPSRATNRAAPPASLSTSGVCSNSIVCTIFYSALMAMCFLCNKRSCGLKAPSVMMLEARQAGAARQILHCPAKYS